MNKNLHRHIDLFSHKDIFAGFIYVFFFNFIVVHSAVLLFDYAADLFISDFSLHFEVCTSFENYRNVSYARDAHWDQVQRGGSVNKFQSEILQWYSMFDFYTPDCSFCVPAGVCR